jgi:4-hydroxy-tetrahydrodipicolinate reductase
MVRAIVTGVSGKMGARLMQFINEMEGIELVGAVDVKGSHFVGQDAGEVNHMGFFGVPVVEDLRDCIKNSCVVIDFTDKESSMDHLKIAAEHKTSMVIGTMGFMLDEMERIPRKGEEHSSNGLWFRIEDANERAILKVRVKKLPPPSDPEATGEVAGG